VPLLDASTQRLLEQERAGKSCAVPLTISGLAPGCAGYLDVVVQQVDATRTYQRKRGGEGLLCRITLSDATGDIQLVLWDDQTRLAQEGPFLPGAALRLHGPTVKDGWRGGLELALGSTMVRPITAPPPPSLLRGALGSIGPAHVVPQDELHGPVFRFQPGLCIEPGGWGRADDVGRTNGA
jgi:hypothetical protein